jgi:hypothetical protein
VPGNGDGRKGNPVTFDELLKRLGAVRSKRRGVFAESDYVPMNVSRDWIVDRIGVEPSRIRPIDDNMMMEFPVDEGIAEIYGIVDAGNIFVRPTIQLKSSK